MARPASEAADGASLSLFPLQTVLLPGASLGLRIFEQRYLDMVRDCGRHGTGFGICLVLQGEETGAPARPAAYGTEAVIEDFGSGDDGLLTLQVRGTRRFCVRRTKVRDNGLIVGDVEWCAGDADDVVQPQHALLSTVLSRILEDVGGEHAAAPKARFDHAAWVGWRLAEFLPLSDTQRQAMLQEPDAHVRLDQLLALMSA